MSEQTSPAINLICDFKVGSSKGESYKKFINYISTEKNKKNVFWRKNCFKFVSKRSCFFQCYDHNIFAD